MNWIKVKVRKTEQEAFIQVSEIAAMLCPYAGPQDPKKPPFPDWYGLMMKGGTYLECEPSNVLDQVAMELQDQSCLKTEAVELNSGFWVRLKRIVTGSR